MKLQIQLTNPNKELRDLDVVKKVFFLEKNLKQSFKDYQSAKDYLVCCK